MRALVALLLATMLLKAEAAGLADQRIDVKTRQVIGSLSDNRRVILARATFATYTSGTNIVVMDFVFPAFSFEPGDMISMEAMGTQLNNTGGVAGAGVFIRISQGVNVQNIEAPSGAPANANPFAWFSKIMVGVNQTGANGQYVPPLQRSVASASQVYPDGLGTSDGIGFAGGGYTLVSDQAFTTASFASGLLLNTVPATTGSGAAATRQQLIFDRSQPIDVAVIIPGASATDSITVQYGVLEGL